VTLRNALSDPDDVSHFLLLQFDERVKDPKVELMQIRLNVEFNLK
jgi:hypothetical protein